MRCKMHGIDLGVTLVSLATLIVFLAGCDSSGSGDSTPGTTSVLTVSGTRVDLSGTTWARCVTETSDVWKVLGFSSDGNTIHATDYDTGTSDGTCGGSKSSGQEQEADVGKGEDATMDDWSDGSNTDTAPTALDGSTPIADPPDATVIKFSIGSGSGYGAFLVDDTGSPRRAFPDQALPTTPCAQDADGFPHCLHSTLYLEEQ